MNKVAIRLLATGVPGLDAILGGGLPELSFNIIVGPPGAGKTTLAHQIMFALATPERPALFFTVFGEPPLKMLRYQQQYAFFDIAKLDKSIHFVNLSDDVATGNFGRVLSRITEELARFTPAFVFVDSFHAALREVQHQSKGGMSENKMVQQLGAQLTASQATTFLIGEYVPDHPIMTVADGLLLLEQAVHRNSMVRKIQILKMRGQATSPGVHSFRITSIGIEVFSSAIIIDDAGRTKNGAHRTPRCQARLAMGVPGLDAMLGGGLPSGYSLLVAGPSGSGKTILATAFLAEGVRLGEPGVIVAFEQTPSLSRNPTIDTMARAGQIGLINTRSLDLSMDEIVQRLTDQIHQTKATRVVIDSLSGFELALAPSFRADFRESLFRMVAVLSNLGVTVLMLSELEDRYLDLRFSPYGAAFLTDAIIVQRYIEIGSHLMRVMAVVKVRGSPHSNEIRQYEIGDAGIVIGDPLLDYEGLLGGRPARKPVSASRDMA
jgi:circadian clock protein KaiC